MALRWKREDYDVVKHDNCFSDWKVLVSGADWKEQNGRGERVRSRNLPGPHVGAGAYELGVTLPAWKTGHSALESQDIVVVYVGHADHIRKRLLRYCQAGAHLEAPPRSPPPNLSTPVSSRQPRMGEVPVMRKQKYSISDHVAMPPRSVGRNGRRSSRLEKQVSIDRRRRGSLSPIAEPECSGSPRGPRLFSEVFALGCSIAFRWASTKSKDDAEFVVSELTDAFDYAWKRGGDGEVRAQDVLHKIVLGKRALHDSDCCSRTYSSRWGFLLSRNKPVGVKLPPAHKPPPEPRPRRRQQRPSSSDSFIMLLRSRPILGKPSKHSEFTKIDIPVDRCGVMLESGLVCNGLPQKGRKRCHLHLDARKTSQVASSQDSRSSEGTTTPRPSSSCFPFLATKKPKAKIEQPRKRGSVSFSTWLSRSELLKAKSMEWLLAMEEIKGRGITNTNTNNNNTTSPVVKPVTLSPEMKPKSGRISLNLSQVDNGMPATIVSRRSRVRWPPAPLRETYATSYNPTQFPRISLS